MINGVNMQLIQKYWSMRSLRVGYVLEVKASANARDSLTSTLESADPDDGLLVSKNVGVDIADVGLIRLCRLLDPVLVSTTMEA